MKTSLLSLFAGTVFLAGAAIAGAGEPVALTSAQLDGVTAAGNHRVRLHVSPHVLPAPVVKTAAADASADAQAVGTHTYTNTTAVAVADSVAGLSASSSKASARASQ